MVIEIDTTRAVDLVALPDCPHDKDPAHDRWECRTCRIVETFDALLRALDGHDTSDVLAILHRVYITALSAHVEGLKGRDYATRRAGAINAMTFMSAIGVVGPEALRDALIEQPLAAMPSPPRVM